MWWSWISRSKFKCASSGGDGCSVVVGSDDAALTTLYPPTEHDNPLGLKGAHIGISLPSNYNQKDVKNMIPPLCDANGDRRDDLPSFHEGDTVTIGQNHAGYYGFRNPADNKTLIDDGAINTVVRDWNITLAAEKQSSSLSQAICNSTDWNNNRRRRLVGYSNSRIVLFHNIGIPDFYLIYTLI